MKRFEERAEQQAFFYKHDLIYREDIELKKRKREKRELREIRALETGYVSDSSSVKEQKAAMKAMYLNKLKQEIFTTEQDLQDMKRHKIE